MELKEYKIKENENGLTVEEYLRKNVGVSARKLQQITRSNGLYVNGKKSFLSKKLRYKDSLKIPNWQEKINITPENGVLVDILYEDERVVVVNKPAGMLVHPTGRTESGTLINFLANRYKEERNIQLYALHRLDRDTSGCVLFAKNLESYKELEVDIQKNKIKRIYYAIVKGEPKDGEIIIDMPIAVHKFQKNRRVININGKPAISKYRKKNMLSHEIYMLEVELLTGRTHQIRVHLAHVGLPILGDAMYGVRSPYIGRQALHAAYIKFWNTSINDWTIVQAPIMQDMNIILEMQ